MKKPIKKRKGKKKTKAKTNRNGQNAKSKVGKGQRVTLAGAHLCGLCLFVVCVEFMYI